MSDNYTLFDAASNMEETGSGLEELIDLLYLYEEHREKELRRIAPDNPVAVACLVKRQHMGLALLWAIEDKADKILRLVNESTKNGYSAARAERAATESEDRAEEKTPLASPPTKARCKELKTNPTGEAPLL